MKKIFNFLTRHSPWKKLYVNTAGQSITKFSLLLLIAFDIYLFWAIQTGVGATNQIIDYPSTQLPDTCIALTENYIPKSRTEKINTLQNEIYSTYANILQYEEFYKETWITNKSCGKILEAALLLSAQQDLKKLISATMTTKKNIEDTQEKISSLKNTYETALLEKIANQSRKNSILPVEATKIKSKLDQLSGEIKTYDKTLLKLLSTIEAHPALIQFEKMLGTLDFQSEFKTIRDKYNHDAKWFPVKLFFIEFLFILPIFILAYFWSLISIRKNKNIQTLISSHVLFIVILLVLTKMVFFVYQIMPHTFLTRLFVFLSSLRLNFIWNYILIFGSIILIVGIILFIQKIFFGEERTRLHKLRNHLCSNCAEKLMSPTQLFCDFCGVSQTSECTNCHKPKRILSAHCLHCGK